MLLVAVAHVGVQSWVTRLSATLAASSIRKIQVVFSGLMKYAVHDRRIPRNPCDLIRLPRVGASSRGYLTPEQVDELALGRSCGAEGEARRPRATSSRCCRGCVRAGRNDDLGHSEEPRAALGAIPGLSRDRAREPSAGPSIRRSRLRVPEERGASERQFPPPTFRCGSHPAPLRASRTAENHSALALPQQLRWQFPPAQPFWRCSGCSAARPRR